MTLIVDELFTFDVLYISAYGVLGTLFFLMKCKNRYDFFVILKYTEIKQSYKELLMNFPYGIILLDENSNPLFCNCVFAGLLPEECVSSARDLEFEEGLPKESVLATAETFVPHEANKSSNYSSLRDMIENWPKENAFDAGKFVHTRGGEQSTYLVKGIVSVFHRLKCKVLILQDQSEIERLQKLNETYQRLYVASIAHDIRTPLNGIIGMLDMMSDVQTTSKTGLYIAVAKSACKLLLYLTYNITDYSQLEANKFKVNIDCVKIREVLEEVSQLFFFTFQKKNLSFKIETDAAVPEICCIDRNRYMQILLNVITNALKFTLQGGVAVAVSHDRKNDLIVTSVKDTGIGIRASEVHRLFKLFGKLENGSLNPQGVGFGLAICRQLSESLGGYINVNSVYGEGSVFTFAVKANTYAQKADTMNHDAMANIDINDAPRVNCEPLRKAQTVHSSLPLDTLRMAQHTHHQRR